MISSKRAMQLAGVSALALVAVGVADPTSAYAACTATLNAAPDFVDVQCKAATGDPNYYLFGTKVLQPAATTPGPPTVVYNGEGDDIIVIDAGTFTNAAGSAVIPVASTFPGTELESRTADILTYGGADTLTLRGGNILGGLQTGDGDDQVLFDVPLDGDNPETISGGLDLGGGDDDLELNAGSVGAVVGGAGVDFVTIDGGSADTNVFLGADDDDFTLSSGSVGAQLSGDAGADKITIEGGSIGNVVSGDDGDDTITMYGGSVAGGVYGDGPFAGVGNDTIDISGGTVTLDVLGDGNGLDGDDKIAIRGAAGIGRDVSGDGGDDKISLADNATIGGILVGGDGADEIEIIGGTVDEVYGDAGLTGADGDDKITISGGQVIGSVFAGGGGDKVAISGTANIGVSTGQVDSVGLENGDDTFTMTGGALAGGVSGGAGVDTFLLTGGKIGDFVAGGAGNDIFDISGAVSIVNQVTAEDGDDRVSISGGSVGAFVDLGAGDNKFTMTGGTVVQYVLGGAGIDTISVGGGLIGDPAGAGAQGIVAGAGDDQIAVSGGTVADILAEDGNDMLALSGGAVDTVDSGIGNDSIGIGGTLIVTNQVQASDGDDDVTVSAGSVGTFVDLGSGANKYTMTGGSVGQSVLGGIGADIIAIGGGAIGGDVAGGDGDNILTVGGGTIAGNVTAGAGNDNVGISGAADIGGFLNAGAGLDTVVIGGGRIVSFVDLGAGSDAATISNGVVGGYIFGNLGDDAITVSGGTIGGDVDGGGDNDTIEVTNGSIGGSVSGGLGVDKATIGGGSVTGSVTSETIIISGGAIGGDVAGGTGGPNTTTISGGAIAGNVLPGAGDDTVRISGAADIGGFLNAGAGLDTVVIDGGRVVSFVDLGDGDDAFSMTNGLVGGNVGGGAGADTLALSGGTIGGAFNGGDGDDSLTVSGGTVNGNVDGGAGADKTTISGGVIAGGVSSETVSLFGGTIGGDITGISGNTLTIQSGSLDLRDGVLFAGANAVGTITDTDLAAGNESQNFTGFDSLSLTNSTLRFNGNQTIQALSLLGGSTLFVNGNVTLAGTNTPLGNLNAVNSLIDLRNGAPSDVLTLGGLALSGTTIRIDVDQTAALADRIISSATTVGAVNTIDILLAGTPVFTAPVDIPILTGLNGVSPNAFLVTGVAGTPSSLFDFALADNGAGDLVLRATPRTGSPLSGVIGAVNSRPADVVLDTVDDLAGQALVSALGLASGAATPVSPAFGVFAAGSFARTDHDGFDISSSLSSGPGPSFTSDDFSAALSLDLDAAKQFQLDKQYGLNIGVYGGYASADVDVGEFAGFDNLGSAKNESGLFGAYGLFRKDYDYVLVSLTGFLGNTDVANDVLRSTGDYDTAGYAVTGSIGHIFRLSDRVRFDLRGGLLGAAFKGDEFTDSAGVDYGESKVSFGAVKFEPGLYADFKTEGGMVFSPYTRLSLQQRFGYKNESSVGGIDFDFEDSDFSASLAGGFNLKATQRLTFSSEINGKVSSDSNQVAGKAGIKVSF